MTTQDVVKLCYIRGVRLIINGNVLRAQGRKGAVNDALQQGIAEHKQTIIDAYGDGTLPDENLPDDLFIPASTPNTIEAIKACIDGQRIGAQAA